MSRRCLEGVRMVRLSGKNARRGVTRVRRGSAKAKSTEKLMRIVRREAAERVA
jgi:hypothetical protein